MINCIFQLIGLLFRSIIGFFLFVIICCILMYSCVKKKIAEGEVQPSSSSSAVQFLSPADRCTQAGWHWYAQAIHGKHCRPSL